MKVTWTSNDGKTFDTEQECLDHEKFLVKRPSLIADAILDSLRAARGCNSDYCDLEKLEMLIEVVELFAEKIGFSRLEGISRDMEYICYACTNAYKSLRHAGDIDRVRESIEDDIGEVCSRPGSV